MVEGRQQDEWSRFVALMANVNNLFTNRDERTPITRFMPAHLVDAARADKLEADESPQVVEANWAMLKAAFKSGRIGGR